MNFFTLYRWTSRYGESFTRPAVFLFLWLIAFGWLLENPPAAPQGWLGFLHGAVVGGLGLVPNNFTGKGILELVGRIGAVYLIAVAIIALRRSYRRSASD